ncbi:jg26134 [Pararge aegeria aegeria]|uniref:Jg26134 protein n=1 Tax=Pararge aegeria aegeria TaxID=348720 RepID=A0A8S4S0G5_9NEOP|nr:jg26134 [Pararge aegeria aegeria]
MCLKKSKIVFFCFLVCVTFRRGTIVAANETRVFEQTLTDLILLYQKENASKEYNASGIDEAPDVCTTPFQKSISENDFIKSKLFEQFQLKDYFAGEPNCRNLCLKVSYKIEEIVNNIITNDNTQSASTDNHANDNNITIKEENASHNVTDSEIKNEKTENREDNTKIDKEAENTINSQNVTARAINEPIQDEGKEGQGKKTAIIAGATVAAVGTTAIGSFLVYKWVQTLLQAGSYRFPA